MSGTKADEYLASMFADSFKRELDGDEAMWRSLPFFAALLGLAVAILPQVFESAARIHATGLKAVAYLLFVCSIALFGCAGFWFARVIRPRDYRYPPYDDEVLDHAEALRRFYAAMGASEDSCDERVRDEIRRMMIGEFAAATAVNRRNNGARSESRTQVLRYATIAFLFAFLSELTILTGLVVAP